MNAQQKQELINKIQTTYNVPSSYPLDPITGQKDFTAKLQEMPVSLDDITYLVEKCIEHMDKGMNPQAAARITYGCLYRQSDIQFDPHKKIAELKKS